MNIKQAKENIKNAVKAYLTKDKFGDFVIPVNRQRPLFLLGAPGIGKTAIMEQIAHDLKIGLVSYSMTHHTRQSALGLPFIARKTFGGKKYRVSEYTMSEIIASVYDKIEETPEGILFLDEINCISESLSPMMLQFLQYKTFGGHKLPDGWVVVTAGNPAQYNFSVREFDIVTWDRIKRIDVEESYEAWREFALSDETHPAIITYLDIKKDDFYKIDNSEDGWRYVTARGWSDLSDIIKIYEQLEIPVNEELVSQYLRNKDIAKNFAIYYDLFKKYRADYQVDKILEGKADAEIIERAKAAKFDERLSLLGLIVDGLTQRVRETELVEGEISELLKSLKTVKFDLTVDQEFDDSLVRQINEKKETIARGKRAHNLSRDREYILNATIEALEEERALLKKETPEDANSAFKLIKADYDKRKKNLDKLVKSSGSALSNAFKFFEAAFGKGGQEMLILVTDLTVSTYASRFISTYGCDEYFANNKDMMFFERQKEIKAEIENLDLDD